MLSLSHRIVEDEPFLRSQRTDPLAEAQADHPKWTVAHGGGGAETAPSSGSAGFEAKDHRTNEMLARYLGDVSQYPLLSSAEEQALWRRVTHWQERWRRALFLSPVALPTLITLWRQAQRGDIPLEHLLQLSPSASSQTDGDIHQIDASVSHLRALSTRLPGLVRQSRTGMGSPCEQQESRRRRRQLWREWLALWNDMPLAAEALDTMAQALQTARRRQSECPALRAAHCALTRAERETEQAKTQILLSNLRLVVYMAKRRRSSHLVLLDLIQEGNAGLMRALERFDPHRGAKFSTYACWWIRQAIDRALANQDETIRVPNHVIERKKKLHAAVAAFRQRHRRAPTDQELSAALAWPLHVVERTQQTQHPVCSLHEGNDDGDLRFDDIAPDGQRLPLDEEIARLQLQQCLETSLDALPKRDAQVLRLRFGLETDCAYTLKEIGEQMGLSRERIRQIEKGALQKLRCSAVGASLAEAAGLAE